MVSMQSMRNFVRNRLTAYGALALASLLLGTTTAGAAEISWPVTVFDGREKTPLETSRRLLRISLQKT